jgi:hypothetical protein
MSDGSGAYPHPIGVSVGDMTPPEELGAKARRLEQLGYSHIMVPEDYFYVPALVGATLYSTVALTCVDRDGAQARAAARPILASFLGEFGVNILTDAYGISEQLTAILESGGPDAVAEQMPDEWLEDLTLVGTPAEVVGKMQGWLDAGLDSICIFLPDEERERATLELVAAEVIPALRGA